MHALALNEMNGVLSSYNGHSGETRRWRQTRWRQTSSIPRLPGKWQASLLYSKTRFKRHPTLISLITCARVIRRWWLLLHARKAVRWLASSCYVVTSMQVRGHLEATWLTNSDWFQFECVYISESSDNFWLTFVILISLVEELGTRLSARSMTNATLKTGNDYCVPFAMMCTIAHTRVFLSSRSQCVETES